MAVSAPWIALVGPEVEENLSLRYLASSLARAGYDAEIVAFNTEADFVRARDAVLCASTPPLVVGLSLAFQWRAQDFLALAVALREGGYRGHITVGGHFATFACRELLTEFAEVDTVVRQEAEDTLVALVRALAASSPLSGIPGLALRDERGAVVLTALPAVPDLATLPWPDRRGEPARCLGHGIAPLVSTRGCYANCSFCCIAAWHEETLPGKRWRAREPDEVAAEMVALQRDRGVDVFVFHDDNFFLPGAKRNLDRIHALADALGARGIGPYATVVKARPTDLHPEVFEALVGRLRAVRAYVGVETDSDQGLDTLRRWATSRHNHEAIALLRRLDLFAGFNLLLFDPDTTMESLRTNVAFIREAPEFPFVFGRVELYAGTPLLARMQREGRCRGDWMQWDYAIGDAAAQRGYALAMPAFHERNFGDRPLASELQGTRFDVEIARHFHPDVFRPEWRERGKELSRRLALDTAAGLSEVLDRVEGGVSEADDHAFVADLSARLRAVESVVRRDAQALAGELEAALGSATLTRVGDRVATPLQLAQAWT